MFCEECGAENMRRTDEPFEETFKGEIVTVSGVGHWVCDKCGETEFSAEDLREVDKAVDACYRRAHGLLAPEQIKSIRKSIGLGQKAFEAMLGVSSPTVSRWETGAAVQSKVADNLIRLVGDHLCAAQDLMERAEVGKKTPAAAPSCSNWVMKAPVAEMAGRGTAA